MPLIGRFIRSATLAAMVAAGTTTASFAQEISQSHLAAALAVVNATLATSSFDARLPQIANEVADRLIRQRPDLHKEISDAVQATAIKLAVRRKDLDVDVARVYAKSFSEDELKVIGTFLASDAGKKYQNDGPKVFAETFETVQRWSDRVGAELLDKTREELKRQGIDL